MLQNQAAKKVFHWLVVVVLLLDLATFIVVENRDGAVTLVEGSLRVLVEGAMIVIIGVGRHLADRYRGVGGHLAG